MLEMEYFGLGAHTMTNDALAAKAISASAGMVLTV